MDAEDDEIYPDHDNDAYAPPESRMHDVDDEEEGEEVESDDDDIQFITDAKDAPKAQPGPLGKLQAGQHLNDRATSKASPTPTSGIKRELTPQAANINRITTPLDDGKPGTDYPARHTSTLDPLNGNPIHPATGKSILETDLDSDFPSESSKPWRKPGADITDYFNYGFDEFTWASYCLKKQQMPKEVKAIAQEADNMKTMFDMMPSAAGMPPMPGMPVPATGGAGAMPAGMPTEEQMQQMMAQMDPNFLAQMMGMPGGAAPGQFGQAQQPPVGPASFGGGGHQDNFGGRGRGRGRGRNWV